MIDCLRKRVRKQPIIGLYFYNLEARIYTVFRWVLEFVQVTVKSRKFELRFFEILANSKYIWDTLRLKNGAQSLNLNTHLFKIHLGHIEFNE